MPPDGPGTAEKSKETFLQKSVTSALLIAAWFSLSSLLSLYNKWMFSSSATNRGLDFKFPLFTTSLHMLVQFIGSVIVFALFPRYKPPSDAKLTREDYVRHIAPCGIATGLDIGFSNASLKTITLAFYTMCKSSSLAFVLLFAFFFHLETPRLSLVGVIAIITAGVVLMVMTETKFVLEGFILVVTASALGGLRWALTQILLKGNPNTSNPFSSIYALAPIMFVTLVVAATILEGPIALLKADLWETKGWIALPILVFPGILAFFMTVAEFGLIKRTSVVTLSVAGIFKEVLTIGLSALIYGDELTPLNVSGLCVTIVGVALYNYLRIKRMTVTPKHASEHANQADLEAEGEALVRKTTSSERRRSREIDSDLDVSLEMESEDELGHRKGAGPGLQK